MAREKLILSADGKVIPELVVGTSIEELNASFQASVARYKAITEAAVKAILPAVD